MHCFQCALEVAPAMLKPEALERTPDSVSSSLCASTKQDGLGHRNVVLLEVDVCSPHQRSSKQEVQARYSQSSICRTIDWQYKSSLAPRPPGERTADLL